ncbi:hypothetical protein [Nostoc favosum]|uniref:Uncharacterized protein n=1 Tax=Nostoc favosum CHAB5714 TaxID=2780399 RepID=A0ABS8I4W0_9NOSO|nr:hypothetical protein [Nostoc favosum]MCC5598597.1 hypothetical protein [Nostoc favosum CHAB5714]
MKSFSSLLGTRVAASIVATLAMAAPTSLMIAGSIHSANATPVKTTTASVQLNQTKVNISQLQISRTQYQAAV